MRGCLNWLGRTPREHRGVGFRAKVPWGGSGKLSGCETEGGQRNHGEVWGPHTISPSKGVRERELTKQGSEHTCTSGSVLEQGWDFQHPAGLSRFHEFARRPPLTYFSLLVPFVPFPIKMPLQPMTEQEMATATEAMNADLLLQLQRCDVSPHTIAVLAAARFTSVMKFQMIGDDAADVGKAAKTMGLDIDEVEKHEKLKVMSDISSLKTAWAACRKYQQAEDQNKADTKVLGLIAPMKSSEYMNLRLNFERAHTVLEDNRLPGQSILDSIEAGLEDGVYRAPRLVELPNMKEVEAASNGRTDVGGFTMSLNMQGGVKLHQPVRVKLAPPADSCGLRDRIRILWVAHEFVKIRHPTNAAMKTSSKEMWDDHLDHILGDKIKGREISGLNGQVKKAPSWELVLHYEEKVRVKAAKLISESHRNGGVRYDMSSALKAARESRELLEDEFLDKLRFQEEPSKGKKRASGSNDRADSESPPPPTRKRKGGGKGGKKGGDNKKGSNSNKPPASADNRTLHTKKDGKPICFHFNRRQGCNRGKDCKMQHLCQLCLSRSHGMTNCK